MTGSPFAWLDVNSRGKVLVALSVLFVLSSAAIFALDRKLVTPEAPRGIVSFELAGSEERAAAILGAWTDHARSMALLIQGADYLYMFIYASWLSLAVALLAARHHGRWQGIGRVISWLILLSIPLDAIENYALVIQLLYGADGFNAALAWACAVPKFALIVVALAYLLLAGLASRRQAGG